MRKMVHYIPRPLLEEICNPDYMSVNFGALLVEVVATVLDHEVGVSLVSLSHHNTKYQGFARLIIRICFIYKKNYTIRFT